MKKRVVEYEKMSFDDFDEKVSPKPEDNDFDRVLEAVLSRRDLLKSVLAVGSVATLGSFSTLATEAVHAATDRFAFDAVDANALDDITLPDGYSSQVVVRWGDPLWATGVEFDHATRGTSDSQSVSFGDNIDGMEIFHHGKNILLVVNNEYTNTKIIWGNRADGNRETDDDIVKGKMAHGLTVVEIAQADSGEWAIIKDSRFNRRVTPDTPMKMTGPAAGHGLLKTAADPDGAMPLGTFNNCGNGSTPWGTYLACEENFNGYFSAADAEHVVSDELRRYGVSAEDWGYGWAQVDDRFDVAKHPNEPNRHGYVVEIDPRKPDVPPRKLSALGRFKHENAELVVNNDGRIVVYMGDDERGEFLYRYVSNGVFAPGANTDSLLEDGKLYAAKFHDSGAGEWLELTPEASGMASMADVCIHTRIAASALGATTMDRPEWVAANPKAPEVYCALTNNKNRGVKTNAGGDLMLAVGPNPRNENLYGQVVRWRPNGGDHASNGFAWDLFVMAGNPTLHSDAYGGSSNVSTENMFNSPDGLKFDSNGILWMQTDGNYSNEGEFEGQGNNQMLAADPATGEIRRFLVGPNECEVTGCSWSADKRTMFIGIQHPGEKGNSHWPEGGDAVPRSAVVAITRNDGGLIG